MSAVSASKTLRELGGASEEAPRLADATVIMIDYQNTYRTGVMQLVDAEEAVQAGQRLLTAARAAGAKVIHIQHDGGEGSPYDLSTHLGAISDEVAPVDGEPVITKQAPNSFHGTTLEQTLKDIGAGNELIIAGLMAHMCVTFTSEGAALRGYRPTVVAETTATRNLPTADGGVVPAATLKQSALAQIGDAYGLVVNTVDELKA
ncbi:cysteine hydrolase [Streptomyces sp. A7024]|uniref:Cysteine hydrolase n=1 Tax=Streptomyces coryli TaxID=1128680 RepID=A0A6G4U1B4_9ACTN|nr:cysteine hydrolase family protein [Streptomyces coryli]NGN65496.1 cysteine hydrolase [Streptomyces coryli]